MLAALVTSALTLLQEKTVPNGGICDAKVHDAVVPALGQFADSFFDALDLDTVRDAMAALADEEGAPIVSYAEAELDRRRRVAALRGNAVCS